MSLSVCELGEGIEDVEGFDQFRLRLEEDISRNEN